LNGQEVSGEACKGRSFGLERNGFSEKENTQQRKNPFSLDPLNNMKYPL